MKTILLIYYNHNHGTYYHKWQDYVSDLMVSDKHVGDINQYNHELVQILVFDSDFTYNVYSYYDYDTKRKKRHKNTPLFYKVLSFFKINDTIDMIIW